MKKNFLALGTCAFALALGLVACDDSTSANSSPGDEIPAEESSSSVILSDSEGSSSSVTSSSSVESSSSVASSSSSSSAPTEDPSDSKLAWQYLNPSIDYGTMTDARDGQVYKTVKICDDKDENCQTWLAENLNYAYTGVKYNYSSYTHDSTSWCYENKASNCDKYGRLYTWSAVMDSAAQFSENAGTKCGFGTECTPNSPHRGICPEGWHVPTNEEYSTLYTYIGGSSTAGSLLKSTSGWNDYNGKSGNGTDKYGFSGLPAGYEYTNGLFRNEGYGAYLWSASEADSGYAWNQGIYYSGVNADQASNLKRDGRSLRCLRDSF
ncbi:MAG: fibrobacter succinogenes major paralogous domain-containing protein [Fibrobacter sp.]|nr:fibrobacter succinogenes major paralogous domain-containing protein [Fibrobacter sp.]